MFQWIQSYLERRLNPPEEERKQVILYDDDWRNLCQIMRSLTFGKHDIMNTWYRMKDRVEERNGINPENR